MSEAADRGPRPHGSTGSHGTPASDEERYESSSSSLATAVAALCALGLFILLAWIGTRSDERVSVDTRPQATVVTASLRPAITTDGKRRNRARLSLDVELRTGDEPVALDDVRVLAAGEATGVDPASQGSSRALDLRSGLETWSTYEGQLRFELAGAATDAVEEGRGALRIGSGAPIPIGRPASR
jgi:hypothetical protein